MTIIEKLQMLADQTANEILRQQAIKGYLDARILAEKTGAGGVDANVDVMLAAIPDPPAAKPPVP